MKHYFCKAGTLFFLVALVLSGCAANAVPSQYDLKLKTKVESLEFEVGGEIAQVEITIDSRRYQELSSEQNIYLSYHILSDKKESIIYDGIRTPLESIDARGIEKEIVDVQAPLEAGEYIVEIDLVEEGVTWFSAQGMPTLKLPLKVAGDAEFEAQKTNK